MSWLLDGLRDRDTTEATAEVAAGFSSVPEFLGDSELRNLSPMTADFDRSREKSSVRPVGTNDSTASH